MKLWGSSITLNVHRNFADLSWIAPKTHKLPDSKSPTSYASFHPKQKFIIPIQTLISLTNLTSIQTLETLTLKEPPKKRIPSQNYSELAPI